MDDPHPHPERIALLAAIRAAPDDDLPRLVYADWLDEHPGSDLHAATAQFIRASCPGRASPRMPAAAYRWLGDHWKRLVPALVACHHPGPHRPHLTARQSGRRFRCTLGLPVRRRAGPAAVSLFRLHLVFSRGFCTLAEMWSATTAARVGHLIARDQPLARLGRSPGVPAGGRRPFPLPRPFA